MANNKGLLDFVRDGLNQDSKVLLTEFTGINDANVLYLYFGDNDYDISLEECVKIVQAKAKFEERNPPVAGTPPVTY